MLIAIVTGSALLVLAGVLYLCFSVLSDQVTNAILRAADSFTTQVSSLTAALQSFENRWSCQESNKLHTGQDRSLEEIGRELKNLVGSVENVRSDLNYIAGDSHVWGKKFKPGEDFDDSCDSRADELIRSMKTLVNCLVSIRISLDNSALEQQLYPLFKDEEWRTFRKSFDEHYMRNGAYPATSVDRAMQRLQQP